MRIFIGLALAAAVSGCANFNSIHRRLDVDNGPGALVDVKQRAIFVSRRDGQSRVCAEPSPDALAAYAASAAAKAKGVDFSAAAQETAAYIGLRTQTIQVLRDGMYRLCEAYLSGAFTPEEYQLHMRRYQRNMVAMLALEQLTSVVKAPPVTLTTESNAEVSQATDSTRNVSASGVTGAEVWDAGMATRSEDAIVAVAETVEGIVMKILEGDDAKASCFIYYSRLDAGDGTEHPRISEYCDAAFSDEGLVHGIMR